jgi:hypothetical protein
LDIIDKDLKKLGNIFTGSFMVRLSGLEADHQANFGSLKERMIIIEEAF